MSTVIPNSALDQLFFNARTYSHWQARAVDDAVLTQLYEMVRLCPTSMNCTPARLVFIKSAEAKERLLACLPSRNIEQTMAAPVCTIVAYDTRFFEYLPMLYPQRDGRPLFENNPALTETTALRNGSLQAAFLIVAARALGLDCGPMSGFDNDKLNAEFFADGRYKANLLVNLGYGNTGMLRERLPRLAFEQTCRII